LGAAQVVSLVWWFEWRVDTVLLHIVVEDGEVKVVKRLGEDGRWFDGPGTARVLG
jgi:hypothetical protein